ncbi:MAG: hypothetical protein ACKO2C_06580 [Actinomycetes bacterium]
MHLTAATRNRWRRTWRSRAAVAGASVVAVGAGAAAIAASNPGVSGAAAPTPTTAPADTAQIPCAQSLREYLREQLGRLGDDDGWHGWEDCVLDPDGDHWTGGRGPSTPTEPPPETWPTLQHTTTRGS